MVREKAVLGIVFSELFVLGTCVCRHFNGVWNFPSLIFSILDD